MAGKTGRAMGYEARKSGPKKRAAIPLRVTTQNQVWACGMRWGYQLMRWRKDVMCAT